MGIFNLYLLTTISLDAIFMRVFKFVQKMQKSFFVVLPHEKALAFCKCFFSYIYGFNPLRT